MSIQPFDASNPEVARLKARLASAEAEAERTRGLLREAMHALVAQEEPDGLCDRIDRHLASRPEGEVLDGR